MVMSIDVVSGSTPLQLMVKHELRHLRSHWWLLLVLGVLLAACGTAAIVFPNVTLGVTFTAVVLVGLLLMIAGVATIVSSFWVGQWSGFLIQLLVGILYLTSGLVIADHPQISTLTMTVFIAVTFIMLGIFRSVAAIVLRFPQWGWALINGVVTLLAGVIIYRLLPDDMFWVIGLLVGIEMLFNGWTWIMLALAIRDLPPDATA
jgi:uncharacterized membrane protein HdeD (DUF308 family)